MPTASRRPPARRHTDCQLPAAGRPPAASHSPAASCRSHRPAAGRQPATAPPQAAAATASHRPAAGRQPQPRRKLPQPPPASCRPYGRAHAGAHACWRALITTIYIAGAPHAGARMLARPHYYCYIYTVACSRDGARPLVPPAPRAPGGGGPLCLIYEPQTNETQPYKNETTPSPHPT